MAGGFGTRLRPLTANVPKRNVMATVSTHHPATPARGQRPSGRRVHHRSSAVNAANPVAGK